jgi:hypothetical protein
MRINKKFLPGSDKSRDTYLKISIDGDTIIGILFLGLVIFCVACFVQATAHRMHEDDKKFERICKMMANGKDYYVTNSPTTGVAKSCKIAPNWKGIDI